MLNIKKSNHNLLKTIEHPDFIKAHICLCKIVDRYKDIYNIDQNNDGYLDYKELEQALKILKPTNHKGQILKYPSINADYFMLKEAYRLISMGIDANGQPSIKTLIFGANQYIKSLRDNGTMIFEAIDYKYNRSVNIITEYEREALLEACSALNHKFGFVGADVNRYMKDYNDQLLSKAFFANYKELALALRPGLVIPNKYSDKILAGFKIRDFG